LFPKIFGKYINKKSNKPQFNQVHQKENQFIAVDGVRIIHQGNSLEKLPVLENIEDHFVRTNNIFYEVYTSEDQHKIQINSNNFIQAIKLFKKAATAEKMKQPLLILNISSDNTMVITLASNVITENVRKITLDIFNVDNITLKIAFCLSYFHDILPLMSGKNARTLTEFSFKSALEGVIIQLKDNIKTFILPVRIKEEENYD
jgi:hypothetical protein